MSRGRLITLEGGEGAGKSTNLAFVRGYLEARGIPLLVTREPGGTPLAESIRDVLLQHRNEAMSPMAELLLLFAARAQHLDAKIAPALASGTWVVCDRFTDATYAYQGYARGLGVDAVATLETLVQGELRPDLTLILDMPVAVGRERQQARSTADRIEAESDGFFSAVRDGYRERVRQHPERCRLIDASADLDSVQSAIAGHLDRLLAEAS